jgi:hypothetical protein
MRIGRIISKEISLFQIQIEKEVKLKIKPVGRILNATIKLI